MATPKVIRSVLWNFLGTYLSRYSDFDGFWLFGFLVDDLGELRINLLAPTVGDPDTPHGLAVRSAAVKFENQARKAGLVQAQVRDAWLTIRRSSGLIEGVVNGQSCSGYELNFSAGAVLADGRRFERVQVVFVAPHNAQVESRSGRAAYRGAAPKAGK